MQRTAVLVDVANLYHSSKESIGANTSYRKLLDLVLAGKDRSLCWAFAYVIDGDTNQEPFISTLRQLGFVVRRKPLITRADGTHKGDWDIGIAVDLIRIAQRADVVSLVTGDGDFVPAVNYVRSVYPVYIEAMAFPRFASRELMSVVDNFIGLDKSVAYT